MCVWVFFSSFLVEKNTPRMYEYIVVMKTEKPEIKRKEKRGKLLHETRVTFNNKSLGNTAFIARAPLK